MVFDFRLKVFYTVATKLSFTKAASELFISQPAITKHIHELEVQLGVRLFNRNGNSITVTPSGEVLHRYAEKVFKLYNQFENELTELNNFDSGSIRIGASTTLAQYVLPRIVALFKKTYPSLVLTIIQGNSEFIEQQIILEKIDIALVEGISHHPQINYQPFLKDEIVLVARANAHYYTKSEIKIEQLLQLPLVLREQGSGTLDVIFQALNKAAIQVKDLKIEIRLDNTESIKQYLLFSNCASFLSIHAISKELNQNELTIIDIKGIELLRMFQFIQLHGSNHKLAEVFKRFCIRHAHENN